MTGIVAIASAVALLVSPLAGSPSQSGSPAMAGAAQSGVEQELIALDKKIEGARLGGETAAVGELLTDDFVQVTAAGLRTKSESLQALTAPPAGNAAPPPIRPPLEPAYTVHVYGDTAVMTHVTKQTDPHDPQPGVGVLHLFLRQQGRWKMAASGAVSPRPSAEQNINTAAYALMQSGKTKEAIELFKMNVQIYPESWNVYDSLGEGYANADEKALAIQNYEKSLQLNPQNDAAKAALAKLKGK